MTPAAPSPGSAPALLPPALALLFAAWCGTFGAGAGWAAAAAGHLLVLASAAVAVPSWRDPWRLGFPGRLLPWALLAAAALAWWLSPVPRAGRVGMVLLPAYLLLPAVAACLWGSASARRWGARGVSAAVALVAGAALVLWLAGVPPRPSLPVGQHLHLTAWLVLLLPLAALPWREGGAWRLLAGGSVLLGAAAVVGGRSLTGGLALTLQGGAALGWLLLRRRPGGRDGAFRGRVRAAAVGLAFLLAGALLLGPDLADLLRGRDPSAAARLVYWRAGWQGVTESPVAGLGPGSTAWTLAAFLRPVPGVNPPAEVVGELHLLPLALTYELGVPGALLAAAAVGLFGLARLRERRGASDRGFLGAGLLGLAGGAAAGLGTADWRVSALPLAAALAAGAALAGGAHPPRTPEGQRRLWRVGWRDRVGALYALGAALVLAPLDLAHRHYDRAAIAPRAEAVRRLDRAMALDPGFPLYRARRAWLQGESAASAAAGDAGLRRAASEAVRAAESAVGVAPLWLAAGSISAAGGEHWIAAAALERACSLDPLGALAPFSLLELGSPLHDRASLGARALAAEPRLAAATFWRRRPDLLERSLLTLAAAEGIDEGWRAAVVERVRDLAARPEEPGAPVAELALTLDGTPAESLSLHALRRTPWLARLALVPVSAGAAAGLADLPPASALGGTDPRLFPPTCTGHFAPQALRKTLWKSW